MSQLDASHLKLITEGNKDDESFATEGIWLAFNKYLYTIVLLFMATFHLNLLGFAYFILFLVHTFAYYSFRSKWFQPDLNSLCLMRFLFGDSNGHSV